MTSKKNHRNNVARKGGHRRRMSLMARDFPLLTGSDLGHRSHSRSHGRSPRGAGHGSQGNGVTHPPNRTTTRTTSPPSGTSPAPSGMDLASNPTTTSTTIRLLAEASSATQPPQAQDAVLVYTVTSLMDSLKPSSASMTPTTAGTRSYLKAVSLASGLCMVALAFTPVGVNLVDRYTRLGAEGQAWNAPAVSQGAVSPSGRPLELAMEADRTGATESDALGIPPSLASGGALALPVSPFGGALPLLTSTPKRARTSLDSIQAVAPPVSGSPSASPTPAIVRKLSEAIGALSAHNSLVADEPKSAGEWLDNNTSIAKPVNVDGDKDDFGSTRTLQKGWSLRANRGWQPLLAALTCGSGPWNAGPGPPWTGCFKTGN
jgi:hypothetical protein